ncbi:sigma-70 family RNA polymerase sigma factor [Mucilaginibacter sp. Bleaf8]|uniref:RNA polymerase sigma factor n=1 Tax=Mucilaginibacter sp. Bleaf8 TaxID=2834430 RepID=UPI001BD01870|nr:sigma factor [Mucilaginibacter sp. Bleaf8]MBS7565490.1 sigma-70 family RNA polymerase sigma factor [Mucilaginibacter sp. Bleaf8]
METIIINNQIILEGLLKAETRQQAFSQLLARYQQRIYFFIRHQGLDHEDTDELVQDVFVRFYRHMGGLNDTDDLEQVVYGLAAESIQQHFKAQPKSAWLPRLILLLKPQSFSFREFAGMLNIAVNEVKAAYQSNLSQSQK